MTIYMIFKSFRKQLSRNISIMIQLMLGSLVMMIALASYNGYKSIYNQAEKVILPNVAKVEVVQKISFLDWDTETTHFSPIDGKNIAYSIVKDKPQVEKIGKGANNGIGYDENTRKFSGILKCIGNQLVLDSCNRELTEMFKFKVKEGIDFPTYYKSSKSDVYIPLIISKKLEEENSIGSIVDIPYIQDSASNPRKFKIIGVLDES